MGATNQTGRTYNQNHVPRAYTPGRRRFSIYWTWSYPWEANRDPTDLDNRFSTMTEVRRVAWPGFEGPEWDKMNFLQGIAGTLELFHRSTLAFQQIVGETTDHPVAVYQRIDQAGYKLLIDERVLADTDTLMVFGLDHLVSEQEAEQGEIDAIRDWLNRGDTCLLLAPHHDVGFTSDTKPRQRKDSDKQKLLSGVPAFTFHLHLPHYALRTDATKSIHVLSTQPIDLSRPHPF